MSASEAGNWLSRLLKLLASLLTADLLEQVADLWRTVRQRLPGQPQGLYEVLDCDVRLELLDMAGKEALLHKHEKVRFLQDNVIAYQDQAWGDGEIFAEYRCSPGVPVDRYREGHRHRVLISLRETKQRGDREEFQIERRIHSGFTRDDEQLQLEVDHITQRLSLSVVFPKERPPLNAQIMEQNTKHSLALGEEARRLLPDGRLELSWHRRKPQRFEAFVLSWTW